MNETAIPTGVVPTCIGVIMDGSRRWAKERGLPGYEGHTEGYKTLQELIRWAREARIAHVAAYAFSTENWQRSEEEVGHLMKLFHTALSEKMKELTEQHVRVRFVGDRQRFSKELQEMMADIEESTSTDYEITLHLGMSYGGRAEIVAAANAVLAGGTPVTEESFVQKLWSYPMPDPDIIIRTGGEKRLSNFLPWQSVYSELFFVDTFWPAFTKEEFNSILAEFAQRERRRGK